MQPSRDVPSVTSDRTRTRDYGHGRNHGHSNTHDHVRRENGQNYFGQQRLINDESTPGNNGTSYIISNAAGTHTLKSKGSATAIETPSNLANVPTKSRSNTTTILPAGKEAELPGRANTSSHPTTQTDTMLAPPLSSGSETDLSLSNGVADVYYYSDSATINSSMIPNYNADLSDDGEEDSFSIDNSNMNNSNSNNNGGNNWYTTSIHGNSIASNSSPYPVGNTADRVSREERDMRRSSIARRSTYNTNRTDQDDASLVPLFSICSSSVKSSIFSDINSLQSTKPTVHTVRTVETNSSIIAIPPASILDRSNTTATAASTTQNVPNSPYYVHSSSVGPSLHRWNSSVTVDSVVTLKS